MTKVKIKANAKYVNSKFKTRVPGAKPKPASKGTAHLKDGVISFFQD